MNTGAGEFKWLYRVRNASSIATEMSSNERINVCIFKKTDGKDPRKTRKQMLGVNGPLHHERLLLYHLTLSHPTRAAVD